VSALAEIRRLYYETKPSTIRRDLAHAIELVKSMRDEDDRSRAAVYMAGLNEMRKEWSRKKR
jgi:hypothetical protein